MDHLKNYWQIEQPVGEEAVRLRRWLLGFNTLLVILTLIFTLIWFYLDRQNESVPHVVLSMTTVIAFAVCGLFAWRGKLWQSALITAVCFAIAAFYTIVVVPSLSEFVVSIYLVVLLFTGVFLSWRLVKAFALLMSLVFLGFSFFSWITVGEKTWQVVDFLLAMSLFGLSFVLLWLNMEKGLMRTAAMRLSEGRYRRLFEQSPIALWEQDGSEVIAGIERLRQQGVTDFRAYFEANPLVVIELMSLVKTTDVNETAVTMYKAKDKSDLMHNLDRFLPEEAYSFVLNSLEAMANRIPSYEQEISSLTLEGEKLTVLYRWVMPAGAGDNYAPTIASIVDVTDRKQVETALKNYSERLHVLHELDLAINLKNSSEEIAAVAIKSVAQLIPSWRVSVWSHDEEGQWVSLLAAREADEEAKRPFPETTLPVSSMLSEEMLDDMRTNQPYVVDDLEALRYLPPSLLDLQEQGGRSFMQVPLLLRDKLIGLLTICDKNANTFTPEYMGIALEISAPLAIALGNVQLFVAENTARHQAETLRHVAAELNTNLELEPLLRHILEYLEQVIPYDSAAVFLEKEGVLNIVAQRGVAGNIDQGIIDLGNEELAVYKVYKFGQPQLIADTKTYPDWIPYPGFEYIRCWLAIPLQVKGKTIGALTLDKSVARFYDEKNQELAVAFANQAAVAIENARLYEQARRYVEELEVRVDERTRNLATLYEITAVASSYLDLDKILDDSIAILLIMLDCYAGAIFLKEADEHFYLKSQIGIPADLLSIVPAFEITDGFAAQIIENTNPLFIRDLAVAPSLKSLNLPADTFSFVGLSMRVKDEVVGILGVVHNEGRQFSPEDIALLSSMSDHFGVVIENGRLHQQNQEMAVLHERERLARELHDSVTQSLYSITLFAEASIVLSQDGNGEKLREYLGDIGITAQQALKEMRLMLYELGSGSLVKESLLEALRYRLESVEGRSGITADLQAPSDLEIPPNLDRALYLVAQEALNNTLKHAKATTVHVTIDKQGSILILTIEDNGRGFSPQVSPSGGMGLKTMTDRIGALGGSLYINSLPGVGTKIQLTIDLEKYGVD